jgi:hypothetical protein
VRLGLLGPLLGKGPPDSGEEQAGGGERGGVDDEGGVAPERRRDDAAQRGPDGEHRPPRRTEQRVRRPEVLTIDEVRERRARRRVEDRGEGGDQREQEVGEPHRARVLHEEEPQAQHGPRRVAPDHEGLTVEAVGQHPAHRRHQEERQLLGRDEDGHRDRGRGELEREPEQGHQEEPVAPERDQGGGVGPPEVPVASQQRQGGPEAPRFLDRLAHRHGDLPDY